LGSVLTEKAGTGGDIIEVIVDNYGDGATALSWPISLDEITYTISGKYLKDEKDLTFKPFPTMLTKSRELKENNQNTLFLRGVILGNLFSSPLLVDNRLFKFVPRYVLGDNKWQQMMTSNLQGGANRCYQCTGDFSPSEIRKLFDYSHCKELEKKGFLENFLFFRDNKETDPKKLLKLAKARGLDSSPIFMEGMFSSYQANGKTLTEFITDMAKLCTSLDTMHCIGWIDRLFKYLFQTLRLDRVIFENILFRIVKRRQLSDCNFKKKRLLILHFEELLKALQYNKDSQQSIKEDLKEVLETYRVIVWISYTKDIAQKKDGIRLLLHYSCFQFSILTKKLPKDLKVMNLFLHHYFSHYPGQFEIAPFRTTNTEGGEKDIHTVKKIFKDTPRKPEETFQLFFEKINKQEERMLVTCKSDEERLKKLTKQEKDEKEDEFTQFRSIMASFSNPKIKIPSQNGRGSEEEISTWKFIQDMREKYPHLLREEGGFVVFDVVKDILQYLEETQPKQKKTKEKSNEIN
jgi:hypothetical protein